MIASSTDELAEFLGAARRAAHEVNRILAEDSLREDLWRILMCLSQTDGVSMGDISASQAIPQATTTRLVDELTDSGFVFRRPSPDDGRKAIVYLSQRGVEKLHRANTLLSAHMERRAEKVTL
ncbi:MarR family winged helix-turn-helix transcriptional regulator [Arthrobacter sp. R4]|uniref:MarR family winged helix-turn-helix transcriptional regulator n=1 Tax=Arthrobacter sp. R4 TaxID=644417 RepID=UPI003EDA55FE